MGAEKVLRMAAVSTWPGARGMLGGVLGGESGLVQRAELRVCVVPSIDDDCERYAQSETAILCAVRRISRRSQRAQKHRKPCCSWRSRV